MELTNIQIRILGCLVEKAATTPDNYPLSTNALVNACNQSTNRDPVVSYDAQQVDAAMLELRAEGLARTVTGGRANKHKHVLDEAWELPDGSLALLAVLFLRGSQTAGELRSRTERLHGFQSVDEVDQALESLASVPTPWVEQLDRSPGQKERRWTHLLGLVTPGAMPPAVSEPSVVVGDHLPDSAERMGAVVGIGEDDHPPAHETGGAARTVDELRAEVRRLRADVDRLYDLLGETPTGTP